MDNKPLELQAKKLTEHKLIKYGFLVTKPAFDKEGTDLLIVKDISQKITPFIKVQCKGRTIKKYSNVTIPKKYVLVADDFAYVPYLEDLQDKGVQVVLFHHSENSGSRIYHRFKWANILYPLALAMGLEQHEL